MNNEVDDETERFQSALEQFVDDIYNLMQRHETILLKSERKFIDSPLKIDDKYFRELFDVWSEWYATRCKYTARKLCAKENEDEK